MASTAYLRADRRALILGLGAIPLVALSGCATTMGRYSLEEGIRRLLQLASSRAFDRLTEPGGFYDDQLTRIVVPELGDAQGSAVLSAILRTNLVRNQVSRSLNDVAVGLADSATPIVLDTIRTMSFSDALGVMRGGPTAATDLLARNARSLVVEAILPGTSRALQSDLFDVLAAALSASSGRNLMAMADNVSGQIGDAIFRAIGREEAEIRRNPRATGDPVLISLLAF